MKNSYLISKMYENNKKMYFVAFTGLFQKREKMLNCFKRDIQYYKKQISSTGTTEKEKEEYKKQIKNTRITIQNIIKEYNEKIKVYKNVRM